ncbi:right-handed parallel beta-helix repeat-containing protein [Alkalibacillus salilacus]|uniref:Parallel beta-helix repeat protein n=1 Tax=Alkalibacillus salilacus TaxID=284582 RepID=A0ABT9VCX5_9BACI|nr:right-handed parallel beta-helix repeat-containing protein [Alkalibacillus salilacus]MDQ0158798.1 parallel beta-helix repeat protein [Alkalibacillus salilacus]
MTNKNKSTAIRIENSRNVTAENNDIKNFDVGIDILDSEDVKVLNNTIENTNTTDPYELARDIRENEEIQQQIEKAKIGDEKSLAFLKEIGKEITVDIVSTTYKAILISNGIEI